MELTLRYLGMRMSCNRAFRLRGWYSARIQAAGGTMRTKNIENAGLELASKMKSACFTLEATLLLSS